MTTAKGFEDLAVFKLAYRTSLEIHRASLSFPAVEQQALADQIRRASKSICANLAEMRVWLRYCLDLGDVDLPTWQRWRDAYQEIAQMLHGLRHKAGRTPTSSDI